jgi:hypothetical protein
MKLPTPFKELWTAWKEISHAIGVVMSSIILTALWILVFGTYAIILKIPSLFAKKTNPGSFWRDASKEHSDFKHQF